MTKTVTAEEVRHAVAWCANHVNGSMTDWDRYSRVLLGAADQLERNAAEPSTNAAVQPFPFDPTAGADASNPYGKIIVTGPNGERIRLYLADRVDADLEALRAENRSVTTEQK